MKKILLFLVLLLPSVGLYSQNSKGGVPPSYLQKGFRLQAIIPTLKLQSMNIDKLLKSKSKNHKQKRQTMKLYLFCLHL